MVAPTSGKDPRRIGWSLSSQVGVATGLVDRSYRTQEPSPYPVTRCYRREDLIRSGNRTPLREIRELRAVRAGKRSLDIAKAFNLGRICRRGVQPGA